MTPSAIRATSPPIQQRPWHLLPSPPPRHPIRQEPTINPRSSPRGSKRPRPHPRFRHLSLPLPWAHSPLVRALMLLVLLLLHCLRLARPRPCLNGPGRPWQACRLPRRRHKPPRPPARIDTRWCLQPHPRVSPLPRPHSPCLLHRAGPASNSLCPPPLNNSPAALLPSLPLRPSQEWPSTRHVFET